MDLHDMRVKYRLRVWSRFRRPRDGGNRGGGCSGEGGPFFIADLLPSSAPSSVCSLPLSLGVFGNRLRFLPSASVSCLVSVVVGLPVSLLLRLTAVTRCVLSWSTMRFPSLDYGMVGARLGRCLLGCSLRSTWRRAQKVGHDFH